MIISASYRTDIPAFYSEWFFARLQAGFCEVVQPFSRQRSRVDLRRRAVDGMVFWTRNFAPMLARLDELRQFGAPFYVQFTLTGYPREIEASVIAAERAVAQLHALRERCGPRAVVWRYDPVLISSLTPAEFHRRNFAALAQQVQGATDEVVVSFAQAYQKTRRNLDEAARRSGFVWRDPEDEEKRALLADLAATAQAFGLRLTVCSQAACLVPGAEAARCIDTHRLSDCAGYAIAGRQKGNRPDCLCAESRDIGDYDTCPHGCAYCYAVRSQTLARARYHRHEPESPALAKRP